MAVDQARLGRISSRRDQGSGGLHRGAFAVDSRSAKTSRVIATGRARNLRAVARALVDVLLALAVIAVADHGLTDPALMVGLAAPLALAAVGAYGEGWSLGTTAGAVLARLLFAAVVSIWVGLTSAQLFGATGTLVDPLAISVVLTFAWLLSRAIGDRVLARDDCRVVIVGASGMVTKFLPTGGNRSRHETLGYFVSGVKEPMITPATPCLGGLDALPAFLSTHSVDRVVIAGLQGTALTRAIEACDHAGVQVDLYAPGLELASDRARLSYLGGVPVLRVSERSASQWSFAVKRAIDVIGASVALLTCAPVLIVVSIVSLIAQGRPLLFRQRRVGLHGEEFEVIKFRTMRVDAEEQTSMFAAGVEAGTFTIANAVCELKAAGRGQATRLGLLLRAASIDELPQLWNVLHGDMSLVGPRPLRGFEYGKLDPWIAEIRTRMRPGMTGRWQVSGRSDLNWDARINLDHAQVRNWSLRDDFQILMETPSALFNGR